MYPSPYNIFGNRFLLEESYRCQVNDLAILDYNKALLVNNPNIFRFCSYNVKYFDFNKDAAELIFNFIKKYNPDAFSLIEYHLLEDAAIKELGDLVMFEQLKHYGISTHFNLNNSTIDHPMTCEAISIERMGDIQTYVSDEKRGFTHLCVHLHAKSIHIITLHLDVQDERGFSRLHEIKEIYSYIEERDLNNVIIIGDFNEWDIHHNEPAYEPTLMEFQERTGLGDFSTQVHDFLKSHDFTNVFHLLNEYPQFSCWSGKLVDFCYKYNPTWDTSLVIKNIAFIYVDYSDHLPIILDIEY